jgi:hypothetical protein
LAAIDETASMPSPMAQFKEFTMSCRSSYIADLNLSPEEREVRRQVHQLRGFYHHLAVFLLVNAGLIGINLLSSSSRLWFYWPLLGWGIWLALHSFSTFSRGRWLGREWEEHKVNQMLANRG